MLIASLVLELWGVASEVNWLVNGRYFIALVTISFLLRYFLYAVSNAFWDFFVIWFLCQYTKLKAGKFYYEYKYGREYYKILIEGYILFTKSIRFSLPAGLFLFPTA